MSRGYEMCPGCRGSGTKDGYNRCGSCNGTGNYNYEPGERPIFNPIPRPATSSTPRASNTAPSSSKKKDEEGCSGCYALGVIIVFVIAIANNESIGVAIILALIWPLFLAGLIIMGITKGF